MKKLIWTVLARKQLKEIKLYYKASASEKVAIRIIMRIQKTAQQLVGQPHLGKKEPMLMNRSEDFRSIPEGHYKIVYWVDVNYIRIISVSIVGKVQIR